MRVTRNRIYKKFIYFFGWASLLCTFMQFHIQDNREFCVYFFCVSCSPVDPHITHDGAYAHTTHLLCYLLHFLYIFFILYFNYNNRHHEIVAFFFDNAEYNN